MRSVTIELQRTAPLPSEDLRIEKHKRQSAMSPKCAPSAAPRVGWLASLSLRRSHSRASGLRSLVAWLSLRSFTCLARLRRYWPGNGPRARRKPRRKSRSDGPPPLRPADLHRTGPSYQLPLRYTRFEPVVGPRGSTLAENL